MSRSSRHPKLSDDLVPMVGALSQKALWTQDKKLIAWPVNADGEPHHAPKMRELGTDQSTVVAYLTIDPDDSFYHEVTMAYMRKRFGDDRQVWKDNYYEVEREVGNEIEKYTGLTSFRDQWRFTKAAARTWKPGMTGRALVSYQGVVHTWPDRGGGLSPTISHAEYCLAKNIDGGSCFYLEPDGGIIFGGYVGEFPEPPEDSGLLSGGFVDVDEAWLLLQQAIKNAQGTAEVKGDEGTWNFSKMAGVRNTWERGWPGKAITRKHKDGHISASMWKVNAEGYPHHIDRRVNYVSDTLWMIMPNGDATPLDHKVTTDEERTLMQEQGFNVRMGEDYKYDPWEVDTWTFSKVAHQGMTNYDTWQVQVMIDNERQHYDAAHALVRGGATPEQLAEWALPNVIAPLNASHIEDAQSWNEIPEEERIDYNYEQFKDKHGDNPKAMDILHGLVGGPDVSDMDPTPHMIDESVVNWLEILNRLREDNEMPPYEPPRPEWLSKTADWPKMTPEAFRAYHKDIDEKLARLPKWEPGVPGKAMQLADTDEVVMWADVDISWEDGESFGMAKGMTELHHEDVAQYLGVVAHNKVYIDPDGQVMAWSSQDPAPFIAADERLKGYEPNPTYRFTKSIDPTQFHDVEPWTPGKTGRILVMANGDYIAWVSEESAPDADDAVHHYMMVDAAGLGFENFDGHVDPHGDVTLYLDGRDDWTPEIEAAVKRSLAQGGLRLVDETGWSFAKVARPVSEEWFGRPSIQEHHLYHITDRDNMPAIFKHGLLPWDHPLNAQGSNYDDQPNIMPRPNHVYLTDSAQATTERSGLLRSEYGGKVVLKIDPRYLKAENINVDEDDLQHRIGPPTPGSEAARFYEDQAGWIAEHPEWDEPETAEAIIDHSGSYAHNGPIPPEAIVGAQVLDYDDEWKDLGPGIIQDWKNRAQKLGAQPPQPKRPEHPASALHLNDGTWHVWQDESETDRFPIAHMEYAVNNGILFDKIRGFWLWEPDLQQWENQDAYRPDYKGIYKELMDQRQAPGWNFASLPSKAKTASGAKTWYHLTDDPNFTLDPAKHPQNNTTLGGDWPNPGLFVTADPNSWYRGQDYVRPFVVELEADANDIGGYAGEHFIPADRFDQVAIKRIVPYTAWEAEHFYDEPYAGSDVRQMTPEEHAHHFEQTNEFIRNERPHMLSFPCSHCGAKYEQWNECQSCGKLEDPSLDKYIQRGYMPQFKGKGNFYSKTAHEDDWTVVESDFDPANSYQPDYGYTHSPWIGDPESRIIYLGRAGVHHDDLGQHHKQREWQDGPFGVVDRGTISIGNPGHSNPRELADALHEHLGPGFSEESVDDTWDSSRWEFNTKTSAQKIYRGMVLPHMEGDLLTQVLDVLKQGAGRHWSRSKVVAQGYGSPMTKYDEVQTGERTITQEEIDAYTDPMARAFGIPGTRPVTELRIRPEQPVGVTLTADYDPAHELEWGGEENKALDPGHGAVPWGEAEVALRPDAPIRITEVEIYQQGKSQRHPVDLVTTTTGSHLAKQADTWQFGEPASQWFKYVILADGTAFVAPEDDAMHSEMAGGLATLDQSYFDPNDIDGTTPPEHREAIRSEYKQYLNDQRMGHAAGSATARVEKISDEQGWKWAWDNKSNTGVALPMPTYHSEALKLLPLEDNPAQRGTPYWEPHDYQLGVIGPNGEVEWFEGDPPTDEMMAYFRTIHPDAHIAFDYSQKKYTDPTSWGWKFAVQGKYEKGLRLKDGTEIWWKIEPSFPLDDELRPQVSDEDFEGWPTHTDYLDEQRINPRDVSHYLQRGPSGKVQQYQWGGEGWHFAVGADDGTQSQNRLRVWDMDPEYVAEQIGTMDTAHTEVAQPIPALYHVAPAAARASIAQHGIDHARGRPGTDYEAIGSQPANYFWKSLEEAQQSVARHQEFDPNTSWDIWEVEAEGETDPVWGEAVRVHEPIPVERIRRVSGANVPGMGLNEGDISSIMAPAGAEGPQEADIPPREQSAASTLYHFLTQLPTPTLPDNWPPAAVHTDEHGPVASPKPDRGQGHGTHDREAMSRDTRARGAEDRSTFLSLERELSPWVHGTGPGPESRPSFKEFLAFGNGGEGPLRSENGFSEFGSENPIVASQLASLADSYRDEARFPEPRPGEPWKGFHFRDGSEMRWRTWDYEPHHNDVQMVLDIPTPEIEYWIDSGLDNWNFARTAGYMDNAGEGWQPGLHGKAYVRRSDMTPVVWHDASKPHEDYPFDDAPHHNDMIHAHWESGALDDQGACLLADIDPEGNVSYEGAYEADGNTEMPIPDGALEALLAYHPALKADQGWNFAKVATGSCPECGAVDEWTGDLCYSCGHGSQPCPRCGDETDDGYCYQCKMAVPNEVAAPGKPVCHNCGSTDLVPSSYHREALYQCRACNAYTRIPGEGLRIEKDVKIPVHSWPDLGPVRQGKVSAKVEDLRTMWGDDIKVEDEDEKGRHPIMQYANGHTLLGPEGAQHYDILNLDEDWDDRSGRAHGFIQDYGDGSAWLEWYDKPFDHAGAFAELAKIFPGLQADEHNETWNFSKTAHFALHYDEETPADDALWETPKNAPEWKPGKNGKAAKFSENGAAFVWAVDNNGSPHHSELFHQAYWGERDEFYDVAPDGTLDLVYQGGDIWDDDEEEPGWNFSKIAGLTPAQKQKELDLWNKRFPNSETHLADLPDGYSLVQLNTNADKYREGEIMRHCWGTRACDTYRNFRQQDDKAGFRKHMQQPVKPLGPSPWQKGEGHVPVSLRDPHGFPVSSFWYHPEHGAYGVVGRGDSPLAPQHAAPLKTWLDQQGTPMVSANLATFSKIATDLLPVHEAFPGEGVIPEGNDPMDFMQQLPFLHNEHMIILGKPGVHHEDIREAAGESVIDRYGPFFESYLDSANQMWNSDERCVRTLEAHFGRKFNLERDSWYFAKSAPYLDTEIYGRWHRLGHDLAPWSEGKYGKALLYPDGRIVAWATRGGYDGHPIHSDVMETGEFPQLEIHKFVIHPDGRVRTLNPEIRISDYDPEEAAEFVAKAVGGVADHSDTWYFGKVANGPRVLTDHLGPQEDEFGEFHIDAWRPGEYGKAVVYNDGRVRIWEVRESDGYPSHGDIAYRDGVRDYTHYYSLVISPRGEVRHLNQGGGADITAISPEQAVAWVADEIGGTPDHSDSWYFSAVSWVPVLDCGGKIVHGNPKEMHEDMIKRLNIDTDTIIRRGIRDETGISWYGGKWNDQEDKPNWLFSKTAGALQDKLMTMTWGESDRYVPWVPGTYGKGFILPNNEVVMWGTIPNEWYGEDGDPAHSDVLSDLGFDYSYARAINAFWIDPKGDYTIQEDTPDTQDLLQSVEPRLRASDGDTWRFSKETLPQQERLWYRIWDQHGLNESHMQPVKVHDFDDDWSVQEHDNIESINATGLMMRNCWQDAQEEYLDQQKYEGWKYYTLNDHIGIPRAAWYGHDDPWGPRWDAPKVRQVLGPRNKPVEPEHAQRIKEWADKSGHDYTSYKPFGETPANLRRGAMPPVPIRVQEIQHYAPGRLMPGQKDYGRPFVVSPANQVYLGQPLGLHDELLATLRSKGVGGSTWKRGRILPDGTVMSLDTSPMDHLVEPLSQHLGQPLKSWEHNQFNFSKVANAQTPPPGWVEISGEDCPNQEAGRHFRTVAVKGDEAWCVVDSCGWKGQRADVQHPFTPWTEGSKGKGLLLDDGRLFTWRIGWGEMGINPRHEMAIDALGLFVKMPYYAEDATVAPGIRAFLEIEPDGRVSLDANSPSQDPEVLTDIPKLDPRLTTEQTTTWRFAKAQTPQDAAPWHPGTFGKGVYNPAVGLFTWAGNEPHHMSVAAELGVPPSRIRETHLLRLYPDGRITGWIKNLDDETVAEIQAIDPRFKQHQEEQWDFDLDEGPLEGSLGSPEPAGGAPLYQRGRPLASLYSSPQKPVQPEFHVLTEDEMAGAQPISAGGAWAPDTEYQQRRPMVYDAGRNLLAVGPLDYTHSALTAALREKTGVHKDGPYWHGWIGHNPEADDEESRTYGWYGPNLPNLDAVQEFLRRKGLKRDAEADTWRFGSVEIQNGGHQWKTFDNQVHETEPWELGKRGKGMVLDGKLHLWADVHGDPHHDDIFCVARGLDNYTDKTDWTDYYAAPKFHVEDDGTLRGARKKNVEDALDHAQELAKLHPDLKAPALDQWKFTSRTPEPWRPGLEGKGYVDLTGRLHTWVDDEVDEEDWDEGWHHTEYVALMLPHEEFQPQNTFFIDEGGGVSSLGREGLDTNVINEAIKQDPRLKIHEAETWHFGASAIPLDQLAYIAEGAMKRGGLTGDSWHIPVGLMNDDVGLPMGRFGPEAKRASEWATKIAGFPIAVVATTWWPEGDTVHASADYAMNQINVRPDTDDLTILHEIAHLMTYRETRETGHTEEWARNTHRLYREYISPEAARTFAAIVWPDESVVSKTAALTRQQLLNKREQFEQMAGPDESEVVHTFPDGWTINRIPHAHGECYEGELMGNCLGGLDSLVNHVPQESWREDSDINGAYYHSVRDPDNVPHGTFVYAPNHPDYKSFWDLDLEGRSGSNAGKYAPYVHDFWVQQGGKPVGKEAWEYEFGTNRTEVGSPQHQAEPADTFGEYKHRGWWGPDGLPHYYPERMKRAVRPMQKAEREYRENGRPLEEITNELRTRLLNNYREDEVEKFIDDFISEQKDWKKWQPGSVKKVHRREMPEFWWMHGTYGPEVMQVVREVQEMYRAISWNHPASFRDTLKLKLMQQADLDEHVADEIANHWTAAHERARGIKPVAPRVQMATDEEIQEKLDRLIESFGGPEWWNGLKEWQRKKFREMMAPDPVPDPNYDPEAPLHIKMTAAAPTIVELDFEPAWGTFGNNPRRPWVYDATANLVYIGPQGTHHPEVLAEINAPPRGTWPQGAIYPEHDRRVVPYDRMPPGVVTAIYDHFGWPVHENDQEDAAETWKFAAYGDSQYNPETMEWNDYPDWEPGRSGKGIIYKNPYGEPWNDMVVWAVDELGTEYDEGYHHEDMIDRFVHGDGLLGTFEVYGDGSVYPVGSLSPEVKADILKMDPRLKFPDQNQWRFGGYGENVYVGDLGDWEPGQYGKGFTWREITNLEDRNADSNTYGPWQFKVWPVDNHGSPHHGDVTSDPRGNGDEAEYGPELFVDDKGNVDVAWGKNNEEGLEVTRQFVDQHPHLQWGEAANEYRPFSPAQWKFTSVPELVAA